MKFILFVLMTSLSCGALAQSSCFELFRTKATEDANLLNSILQVTGFEDKNFLKHNGSELVDFWIAQYGHLDLMEAVVVTYKHGLRVPMVVQSYPRSYDRTLEILKYIKDKAPTELQPELQKQIYNFMLMRALHSANQGH
jgi:hypothetical protein